MNLTDLTTAELDADGLTTQSPRYADLLTAPAEHTAAAAAPLTGADLTAVRSDETQNIRGGAALLASYARSYSHGRLPKTVDGWYAAAARYSQSTEDKVAQVFADEVWSTLRTGAALTTQDGRQLTLAPVAHLHPNRADVRKLGLTEVTPPPSNRRPECPISLHCDYIPGAYTLLDPSNLADYGSHDLADRPNDLQIRYITLHSTDETYDGTAPSTGAPLLADPYLHPTGAGTTAMNDWGDKAPTCEQYVVADRAPGWTAIWFGGQEAWLQDSPQHPTTVPVTASRIVPKPGKTAIPVYTTAYPEASVYPPDFIAFEGGKAPRAQLARTRYTIKAGQSAVESGPAMNTDTYFAIYYDGSAPYDQHDFVGRTQVYEIVFNHRMAFVNAADVDVILTT